MLNKKEKRKIYIKKYREKNKKHIKESRKEYNKKYPEKVREWQKRNYIKHKKERRDKGKKYYIKNKEILKKKQREYTKTPIGIWVSLGKNKGKREITKKDFIEWYNSQNKKCIYCGVSEQKIKNTKFRCWKNERLQIDRKNNLKPYKLGNITLACQICNFTKGDYFTFKEMKKIGKIIMKKRSFN